MSKIFEEIGEEQIKFIEAQKIFFVGTAAKEGTVNVSPKGMDTLRVVDPNHVIWLNLTGSGNETAAHLLKSNRMTLMFCAFEGKPLILRLYGEATTYHPGDEHYEQFAALFPPVPGARQVISMKVNRVQTSCGFAVPFMDFKEERNTLLDWAEKKGTEGISEYWQKKNTHSIDGFETGM